MYKTVFFLKTNNALSHLEKHSYFDLIELFLSRRIPTGHFSYQLLGNFGVFFFSLIQASVTCTFLLFLNPLYFEFEIFLNNFPHE